MPRRREHAALADGQRILELGCGWGSLSLWMARHYPAARIVSVSNSHSQRASIAGRAEAEGLRNLTVVAADINAFTPPGQFDRVVSVEMFEHMSNWRELLRRVVSWLTPQGALFLHIFSHRRAPYRFDAGDRADWIAQHFFTGGIMPSHGLIRQFDDLVAVEAGMVVGRHALPAHRRSLAGELRPQRATRSMRCCATSTAPTRRFGIGAGVCSCTRPQACSATAMARNGASAITGCGRRASA